MMYTLKNNINKIAEQFQLTDSDKVLLIMWFETKSEEKQISLDERMTAILEAQAEYNVRKRLLATCSKNIWEMGSINLLNAIHEQKSINIGFLGDQHEVLPKEMLPRLSSFTDVKSSDPRAHIAKSLGAKVVL